MLRLGSHLTAKVGGDAENLFEPTCQEEFVELVGRLRRSGQRFRLLGGGSNVIAGDGSFNSPVVWTRHLDGCEELSETRWRVEAGANLGRLCLRSARRGLSGLECCTGIPGTIGAAIRINAGGKYGTVAAVTRKVTLLTSDLEVVDREVIDEDFQYRRTTFFDDIVLSAELLFVRDAPASCRQRIKEVLVHKRTTQPLKYPSAGCVFRNPVGDSAGRLIDAAGLKGLRVGGAQVSELHANYLVNCDDASGDDFVKLIRAVQESVLQHSGIKLELEVDLWEAGSAN